MPKIEEMAGGLQRSLARGIGSAAASYRCYLARTNALAVAQARTAEENQFSGNWLATFACLFQSAVHNTLELTHLVEPDSFEDFYSKRPVRRAKKGFLAVCLVGWRRPGFEISARDVQYILNTEMSRLCKRHGLPDIHVNVQYREHNQVRFALAFSSDLNKAREKADVQQLKI